MIVWDNWLIIAFLGSVLFAVVNLIDCYFVLDVYRNEYDGTVISAIFQIVAVIILFSTASININFIDKKIALLAILGGLFFVISSFFYFKAMFVESDASIIETMFSLSMFVVPILAFFLIHESLTFKQYAGIAVAFVGVNIPIIDSKIKKRIFFQVFKVMLGAIIFLALCLIIEEYVYNKTNFTNGYLFFSVGSILGGVLFFCLGKLKAKMDLKGILKLNKKYFAIFFIAEIVAVSGVTFTQRALDKSPAVSFVAMIGGFQPMFVIIISAIFFFFSNLILSKNSKNIDKIKAIYILQSRAFKVKILAILAMIIGVYLIK